MDFIKTITAIAKVFAIAIASYFMCLVTLGLAVVLFSIFSSDLGTHGFFTWTSWPMDLTRIYLKIGLPSFIIGFSVIGKAIPKSRLYFYLLGFILSLPMILFHIGHGLPIQQWSIQRETIPYLIAFAVSGLVFGLFWWLTFMENN